MTEIHIIRNATVKALDLSRDPDPSDELGEILNRVVLQYGEDALREYIRLTLRQDMNHTQAGVYVFSDAAIGQQLGIVISQVVHSVV